MIDFHCHLDLFPDPVDAVKAADVAGVYLLSVTTTPKAFLKTAMLAKRSKRIRTALGLHPEIAHLRRTELPLFDRLVSETQYVGEVGLDGSRDFAATFRDQAYVFDHILSTCVKTGGRILSIHSRNAVDEVLDALARQPGHGTPVLHWFSGNKTQLGRAVEMGCWFSVGEPMTKSSKGKALIAQIPRDRLLTETDAPFTPRSGERYSSQEIGSALRGIASIWGLSNQDAGDRVTSNLRTLVTRGKNDSSLMSY